MIFKDFKTGDKVVHTTTMSTMTIKKTYGNISVCYRPVDEIELLNKNLVIDTYVLTNENLFKV